MTIHQGKQSSWLIIRPIYWQRWAIASDITHSYLYLLYLMDEDTILLILILHTDLPIFTTNAGQWSNHLIFPDNGQIIHVGIDKIRHMMITHLPQKIWEAVTQSQ